MVSSVQAVRSDEDPASIPPGAVLSVQYEFTNWNLTGPSVIFLNVELDVDFDLLIDKFLLISKNLEVGMNDELEVHLPFCILFPQTKVSFF